MILIEENVDCDFCGKVKPKVASTSRGNLCIDCLKMYKTELNEAIKVIGGKSRNVTPQKDSLDSLKRNADEALSKLFTGKVY